MSSLGEIRGGRCGHNRWSWRDTTTDEGTAGKTCDRVWRDCPQTVPMRKAFLVSERTPRVFLVALSL